MKYNDGLTPEELENGIERWRLSPEGARKNLTEIRDIIDRLLVCDDDVKRIRLFRKIQNRLLFGWARPDYLLWWSKIANTPKKPE